MRTSVGLEAFCWAMMFSSALDSTVSLQSFPYQERQFKYLDSSVASLPSNALGWMKESRIEGRVCSDESDRQTGIISTLSKGGHLQGARDESDRAWSLHISLLPLVKDSQ